MRPVLALAATAAMLLVAHPGVTLAASATDAAPQAASPAAPAAPAASKARHHHLRAGEYATEAEAKQHCRSDTVVWASSRKVFHLPGTKHYGSTRHGAYGCEADLVKRGLHVAHGEVKSAAAKPAGPKAGS